MLHLYIDSDSLILDFFSGSATTAHAVMQLNTEDGGNRKFICVQLPEPCDEKSEAFKAGYKNICEIGKERIRRAGEKILNECGVLSVESGVENTNNSTLQTPNCTLYSIGMGMLIICLADNIGADVAKFISDYKKENEIDGMRVVFADGCFGGNDSLKTNIKEILKVAGVSEL